MKKIYLILALTVLVCGAAHAFVGSTNVYNDVPLLASEAWQSNVTITNTIVMEDVSFDAIFEVVPVSPSPSVYLKGGSPGTTAYMGLGGGDNARQIDSSDGILTLSFVGFTNVVGASESELSFGGFISVKIGSGSNAADEGIIYEGGTSNVLYSWTGGLASSPATVMLSDVTLSALDIGATGSSSSFEIRGYAASFSVVPEGTTTTDPYYNNVPLLSSEAWQPKVLMTNSVVAGDVSFDVILEAVPNDPSPSVYLKGGTEGTTAYMGLGSGDNSRQIDSADGMLSLSFVAVTNIVGTSEGNVTFGGFSSVKIGSGNASGDEGVIYGGGTSNVLYSWSGGLASSPLTVNLSDTEYDSIDIAAMGSGSSFEIRGYAASFLIAPPEGEPFFVWSLGWGGVLSGSDANTSDYDNDGASDYREYALNGNPTNSADTGQVEASNDGTTFTYVYAKRADDANIVYTLVDMDDLVAGTANTNNWVDQSLGPVVGDYQMVTNRYDMTGISQQFIKLIVE